jgi:MFS family permease
MVPELVASFGMSLPQLGYLTSIFLYTYLLLQVPGGMLADRVNLRWLLVICFLLLALGCYWFSIANSFHSAVIARAMMGLVTAPSIAMALVLASRWFPASWFPVVAGLVETITIAGGGLGPVFIPELMKAFTWREVMQWLAVVGVILSVLCFCFVRNRPVCTQLSQEPTIEKKHKTMVSSHFDLLRNKDFWLCCIYSFGMFTVLLCFGGLWGVPYLCECYPEHQHDATNIVSLMFVGAAAGIPIIGFLATMTGSYRRIMRLTALLCLVGSLLAIYIESSLFVTAVLIFLAGFCCGGYLLAFAVVKRISGQGREGVAMALINAFTLLGGSVMQPLVGVLLEKSCDNHESLVTIVGYQSALLPIIIVQIIAFIVTFFFSDIDIKVARRHSLLSRKSR